MLVPFQWPLPPMLARRARELPRGEYLYEPKWDGFRALALRDGDEVDIRSRHGRPLARYFPDVAAALRALPARRFVLDGEIVMGSGDFAALMARLHPTASRVEPLRHETPAFYVAFDLLAIDDHPLLDTPFAERRGRLVQLVRHDDAVRLTPATDHAADAEAWLDSASPAIDGVVAKHRALSYSPGRREMVKVKTERTADCVVAGFRWLATELLVGSLLLGLHDHDGELRHVGVVTSFPKQRRRALVDELAPFVTTLEGHPWEHGFGLGRSPLGRLLGAAGRWVPGEMELDWVPLRPELVCEVAYDQVDSGRFRHPARFRRWRPDRIAASCTLDQLNCAPVAA